MSQSRKITFQNRSGISISAKLELPVDQKPSAFALFAHCFTCNKNLSAIRNISRALNQAGIAVLRFDFTGLGESEGDFSETNFSSNVSDLEDASQYLSDHFKAPALIIGHSLGGAAVIHAAQRVQSIKAMVTIGAPSDPAHVTHLISGGIEAIKSNGEAQINIGGRPFTIKEQFLNDLESKSSKDILKDSRIPILVMHSPQDTTVGIENAAEIYTAAWHPKSFISLDGADHLLSNKSDSIYVGSIIATWSLKYMDFREAAPLDTDSQVVARIDDSEGYTTEIKAGNHHLLADEPTEIGGNDLGPSPYHYVSAGLAACTVMTLKMYANRKEWPLKEVLTHVEFSKKHCDDCENPEDPNSKIEHFERIIDIQGDLDNKQVERLMQIAEKCPVHRTLHGNIHVNTVLGELKA